MSDGHESKKLFEGGGGNIPEILTWDESGIWIGKNKVDRHWKKQISRIEHGGFRHAYVEQGTWNTRQPSYALFAAGHDPICIAAVSTAWLDDNKYAWLGNWGRTCNLSWFYSNVVVDSGSHKPMCTWIDWQMREWGEPPRRRPRGFQVHWASFLVDQEKKEEQMAEITAKNETIYYCNSMYRFHAFDQPENNMKSIYFRIPYPERNVTAVGTSESFPDWWWKEKGKPGVGPPNRRDILPRSGLGPLVFENFIVTHDGNHTVEGVCNSPNSCGPDMANMQQMKFCRMSDKTIWPICQSRRYSNETCFNTETGSMVVNGVAKRSVYSSVTEWLPDGETRVMPHAGLARRDLAVNVDPWLETDVWDLRALVPEDQHGEEDHLSTSSTVWGRDS